MNYYYFIAKLIVRTEINNLKENRRHKFIQELLIYRLTLVCKVTLSLNMPVYFTLSLFSFI
jgi:hypothetical protein